MGCGIKESPLRDVRNLYLSNHWHLGNLAESILLVLQVSQISNNYQAQHYPHFFCQSNQDC